VGQSIAYGYLPAGLVEPGTALDVYAEGEWHRLTVAAEPLFDPTNARLRDVEEPVTVKVA
ncbi:MAG TPA: glycine cleavage T C-terminal barrel domain-containing protein, partial [Pseudaminobacter sp.]|nr:glycine cleavage T C-terminal barrel domain-containing protein [Pseudaminobacter sp.]